MKINKWIKLVGMTFLSACLLITIDVVTSHASVKYTTSYYADNKHSKYIQIKGSKYDAINKQMRSYIKKSNKIDVETKNNIQNIIDGNAANATTIEDLQQNIGSAGQINSPKITYDKHDKLSVVYTVKWWYGGATGGVVYATFNAKNGKPVNLAKVRGTKKSLEQYAEWVINKKYFKGKYFQYQDDDYPPKFGSLKVVESAFSFTDKGIKLYTRNFYGESKIVLNVPKSQLKAPYGNYGITPKAMRGTWYAYGIVSGYKPNKEVERTMKLIVTKKKIKMYVANNGKWKMAKKPNATYNYGHDGYYYTSHKAAEKAVSEIANSGTGLSAAAYEKETINHHRYLSWGSMTGTTFRYAKSKAVAKMLPKGWGIVLD